MGVNLRHVRIDEFDEFMRLIERAFGHSRMFFQRVYPHLYRPTEEALSWAYVIEEDGQLVSHVGLYPIEAVTAGVHLNVGGIGAVSTAPQARGKGYMSRLLFHIVDEMRRLGYAASWLGGDRQRYNTFGWELASPIYELTFSRRSFGWHEVEPVEIDEVLPDEAMATIRKLSTLPACHTIRPHLEHQIHKMGVRIWIAEDGYAILEERTYRELSVLELVSASGNEAGMLRSIMDWCFAERINWPLSIWDRERVGRLMPYSAYWRGGCSGMYRVNDLAALLVSSRPVLESRAAALCNFAVALGVREHDRTTVTTVTVEDGEVGVEAGRHTSRYVELPITEATRFVFGGPPVTSDAHLPEGLQALFPIPCYVLPFDHV